MRKKKTKIGGRGCLVEVDETKLTKRKGNVGRIPETVWCVGGICRTHKKFFYELVRERNSKILHDILLRNVCLETTIVTDEWRGYNGLDKVFFKHLRINHSKHFVDTNNLEIHTQTTESLWGRLKRYIKKQPTNQKGTLKNLVNEFKFKRLTKDVFHKLSTTFL